MPGSNATPIYGWTYNNRNTDPLTYEIVSGEEALLQIEPELAGVDTRLAAVEAVATELGDAFTTYTPAWTSITGSNPVAATHSVTGRCKKTDSKLALVEFLIVGLSASDWGTGVYGIGLPFAITATSRDMSMGSGHVLDSGTQEYTCSVRPHSTTVLRMHPDAGNVAHNSPFTFTTNDRIRGSIWVEPA
jgi:hypothetical protein